MRIPTIGDSLRLALPVKIYEPEKVYMASEKGWKHPPESQGILMKITPSDSA